MSDFEVLSQGAGSVIFLCESSESCTLQTICCIFYLQPLKENQIRDPRRLGAFMLLRLPFVRKCMTKNLLIYESLCRLCKDELVWCSWSWLWWAALHPRTWTANHTRVQVKVYRPHKAGRTKLLNNQPNLTLPGNSRGFREVHDFLLKLNIPYSCFQFVCIFSQRLQIKNMFLQAAAFPGKHR